MDFKALSNPVTIVGNSDSKPSFFQKIGRPFSNIPKGKKSIVALTVFMIFALALGIFLVRRPTQLSPQAGGGGVSISLKPETVSAVQNQEFIVDVFIDTNTSSLEVSAAQVKVLYDQTKLELKTTALQNFLPVVLQQPNDNSPGSTAFVVGSSPTEPKSGSGIIAKLTFKALASTGTTQVTFDAKTSIAGVHQPGSVAKDFTPTTVTFSNQQASASPSSPVSTAPETSFTLESPPSLIAPNQEFSVKVYSRSDIDAANLWNAKINFPKNLVEVVRIDKTGSFITNWVEEFFSNTTGEISLTGGVPNPGINTNNTNSLMATIVFKAKAGGTANVNFLDTSTIYLNSNNTKISPIKRNLTVSIANNLSSPSPTTSSSPSSSPSPSSEHQGKGDGNNDGKVDLQDLSILFSKWSPAVNIISHFQLDFDDNLRINSLDYGYMRELLIELGVIRSN